MFTDEVKNTAGKCEQNTCTALAKIMCLSGKIRESTSRVIIFKADRTGKDHASCQER